MHRLRGFTDLLIPDDGGRRAFDETVADWREERGKAGSTMARVGVDLRALLSVARVFMVVGSAGLLQSQVWSCLLATSVAAAAVTAAQIWRWAANTRVGITLPELLSLLPMGLAVFGVIAISFGFGLKRDRTFPGMTLAVAVFLMTSLTLGFIAPASNQYFRVSVLARHAQGAVLERGIPELTAPELARRALSDESGAGAARAVLLQRLIITITAPVMLLLGAALRARLHRRYGWRTSQIAGGIAACLILISGGATGVGAVMLAQLILPESILSYGDLAILSWIFSLVFGVVATLWLSRRPVSSPAP